MTGCSARPAKCIARITVDRNLRCIIQNIHGHGRAHLHTRGIMRQFQIKRRLAGQTFIVISGVSMGIVVLKRVGQLTVLVRQQPLAFIDGKSPLAFTGGPAFRVQRIAFGQVDRLRDHAGIRRCAFCQTAFVHLYGLIGYRHISAVRQINLDVDRRTRRVVITVQS